MSDKKYYVMCGNNCKYEGMTKEQIMTAIESAISTGEIGDVDTGFVTKIKEMNSGAGLSFWVGTQAEYNALDPKLNNCFYIITDDTTADDINKAIETMQKTLEEMKNPVAKINGFNAVLWEGTAARGAQINCPNIHNYNLYALEVDAGTDNTDINVIVCYKRADTKTIQGSLKRHERDWCVEIGHAFVGDKVECLTLDIVQGETHEAARLKKIIGIM